MKKKRFAEEQIIAVLKEDEAGAPTKDLYRRQGIREQSLYRWRPSIDVRPKGSS